MNLKKEKGITLIALVITIIVLLILAGVTINMVLGNDGIIAQAQGAQKAQTEAELKEKIELWNGNVRLAELGKKEITDTEYEKFEAEVVALAAKAEIENVDITTGKITIDGKEVLIRVPSNITTPEPTPSNMITFTVYGYEMQAEEGTTWGDFIGDGITIPADTFFDVEVDELVLFIAEYDDGDTLVMVDPGASFGGCFDVRLNGVMQTKDDVIVAGAAYYGEP